MRSMTARRYPPYVGPEQLERLAAAYSAALGELQVSDSSARRRLAERVVASARRDSKFEVGTLKNRAVRNWHKLRTAPFRTYRSFFTPAELEAMAAAYEAAWQDLWASGLAPSEARRVQKQLAQIILAAACAGARDIERLKQTALRAIGKASSPAA
jgi:hypothetical protein